MGNQEGASKSKEERIAELQARIDQIVGWGDIIAADRELIDRLEKEIKELEAEKE